MSDPITSTVRGVENRLDLERIYRIFDIAPVGLKVHKSKMCPLCRDLSLERLLRGFVDFQTPTGWANPQHTA